MAPELKEGDSVQYSKAVDVYAFGVLLVELFAEKLGYDTNYSVQQNDEEEGQNLLIESKATKNDFISFMGRLTGKKLVEPLRNLISDCMHVNPELRPSVIEILMALERIRKVGLNVQEINEGLE